MSYLDHYAKVMCLSRNDAEILLEVDNVDHDLFEDVYGELLAVADKKCHMCPTLASLAIEASKASPDSTKREAISITKAISERRLCDIGARLEIYADGDESHFAYD